MFVKFYGQRRALQLVINILDDSQADEPSAKKTKVDESEEHEKNGDTKENGDKEENCDREENGGEVVKTFRMNLR